MKFKKKNKKNSKAIKIGLVLPQTPLYSETFFNTEIKMLLNAGFEIELFVWKKRSDFNLDVKVHQQLSLENTKKLTKILKIGFTLFKAVVFFPRRLRNYINLLRNQECNNIQIIERIFSNFHILNSKSLDRLHFGYISMAAQKEVLAQIIGAKMSVSIRGYDIGVKPIIEPRIYDNLWQYLDKVHVRSEDLLQKAYDAGMPKNIPVRKIPPSVPENLIFKKKERIAFKHGEPIRIITIARLHWKKGLDYTLHALSILKEKNIPFSYVIIGKGKEREKLLYEIHDLNLSNQVQLLGRLSQKQIINYLATAEVSINYSLQEGFCKSTLEAQAMGNLCIVSDAEGLPENIENKKSGWVLPKRRPLLLANKIEEIYHMKEEKLLEISRYASERVQTQFSIEKNQQAFIRFYSE